MKETTLLLALDGCRRDYITPENAPFLHALMQESVRASIEPPPGFTQRTSMFTGTYPDTSNAFSAFDYDPARSPFRWMNRIGALSRLYRPRKALYPARLAVKQISRWTSGQYHTDPAWIPGPFLPHFSVVEDRRPIFDEGALPLEGIFDLLRARGRTFKYIAPPAYGSDDDVHRACLDTFAQRKNHAFVFAQLGSLDARGHRHGPLVPEGYVKAARQTDRDRELMRRAIVEVDRRCQEIHEALARNYDRFHFLAIGDHGMAPVMRKVNVLEHIDNLALEAGEDFVLFLDSTIARVWFRNEAAKRAIRRLLQNADYGRIVDERERIERRIPRGRRYGDCLFAADPGILFWPDYFHVVERDLKGMHGYLDKRVRPPPQGGEKTKGAETTGMLVLDSPSVGPARDLGLRNLVDVFPTVCELAKLRTPTHNEGNSFLRPAAAAG